MTLFGGVISISGITFLMFSIFAIIVIGFALGRITVKGISLGDAGVFIVALVYGCLFYDKIKAALPGYDASALKIVENLGLILFVTSVGFIAGPKFFGNLKKNFKSYVMMGLVIILAGGLSALLCVFIGNQVGGLEGKELVSMVVGLLSGSLTSTPAFSAAKQTVATMENAEVLESLVTVGHGISYIFGVIGVVLFVQIVPKVMKADMVAERALLTKGEEEVKKAPVLNLIHLDHLGFAAFGLAASLGAFVGNIKIPLSSAGLSGTTFSLTVTGGCLLMGLLFGHFNRIGKLSIMPEAKTLSIFKELGLILFLVGAGIAGGAKFVQYFEVIYFGYGIIMTVLPMIIGFFFAKYVLKLSLLNNLGSLTGGMTSTPALGTLINVAGTEDVAAAYAATYPVALIAVVLVSQFLIILF
ncbi:MAG: permease [Clostridia bacterium]|nr:permease [Clostridia bacterium]